MSAFNTMQWCVFGHQKYRRIIQQVFQVFPSRRFPSLRQSRVATVKDGEHLTFTTRYGAFWWMAQVSALYDAHCVGDPSGNEFRVRWGEIPAQKKKTSPLSEGEEYRYEASINIEGGGITACQHHHRARIRKFEQWLTTRPWWTALINAAISQPSGELALLSRTNSSLSFQNIPQSVDGQELLPPPRPHYIQRAWNKSDSLSLSFILGRNNAGRDVPLDLVAHGPHALIAGTTGSGKSELLTSWILQLTHRYSPEHLSLVLVDYKGGATCEVFSSLPHVAGVLTDLDPQASHRALASLEAELASRERRVAHYGARSIDDLPDNVRPPRLLIIIDEFAVLVREHADILDSLVRLGAQGRSLGVHLVFSTQRPQGQMSLAIRTNVAIRVCLRVHDVADGRDVVDDSVPAEFPTIPGRLACRYDGGALVVLQSPWMGQRHVVESRVRLISAAWSNKTSDRNSATRHDEVLLRSEENGDFTRARIWKPWADPLPHSITQQEAVCFLTWANPPQISDKSPLSTDFPGGNPPGIAHKSSHSTTTYHNGNEHLTRRRTSKRNNAQCSLPLLLTDFPDEQRLSSWSWDSNSELGIFGAPRSGVTTALLSAAGSALASGRVIHTIGLEEDVSSALATHPGVGTTASLEETMTCIHLLRAALSGDLCDDVVVVDRCDELIRQVDRVLGPGEGISLMTQLLLAAHRKDISLLFTGTLQTMNARWTQNITQRIILGLTDPRDSALAGLPRWCVGDGKAGRGILRIGAATIACQVCLPVLPPPSFFTPARKPLRFLPLPDTVMLPHLPDGHWGLQAPCNQPLSAPSHGHVIIAGPPCSGKSTALLTFTSAMSTQKDDILAIDDIDQESHEVQQSLERHVRKGGRAIVTMSIHSAAMMNRGALALMRHRALIVILSPSLPQASMVAGCEMRGFFDPALATLPGRGVMVERGRVCEIQVGKGP
ncbi:FtsK/SpoIIIE domain-containing protein [Actinomyces vulturis]|uniref:FtsK/SpoIIIE domain-containing protein n=1 Tax=Actinomyces vulturis TaxID=1857645 RepID=UPI00083600BB|nr:FtsK/SpoIIIE domain-containing protein [Actinomyces vulturis]